MRIILTEKGKEEAFQFNDLNQMSKVKQMDKGICQEREQNSIFIKKELNKIKVSNKAKKINHNFKSEIYFEEEEIKPTYKQEIKIQPKKIILPKFLIEQYNNSTVINAYPSRRSNENDSNKSFNIIDTLSPSRLELDNTAKQHFPKVKSTITLKQIIKPGTLNTLYKECEERDLYFKIIDLKKNKNQVRDDMSKISPKNRINKILNRHIPIDQQDIIKYINSKTFLSEPYIKKISEASNEKQKLLNKICQKTMKKQEEDNLKKDTFQERIIKKRIKMKEESVALMNKLDMLSRQESILFEDYNFSNRRPLELLIDKTNKYRQIWKRKHVDRFNKSSKK